MILGIGTDIVAVHRLTDLVGARGQGFVRRWFTETEAAYCLGKAHPARHLAARLAAKEAVAKALRLDLERPVPWRDIEVVLDRGVPGIRLHGELADRVPASVVWHVSLSHSDDNAVASVVLESVPPGGTQESVDQGGTSRIAEQVGGLLADLRHWVGQDDDPELGALRTAILVEELTGSVLSDDQLDPRVLADAASIEAAVRGTGATH